MMRGFVHIIPIALLALLVSACEKPYPWDLHESQERTLVVDALITNEPVSQTIILSLSNPGLNTPKEFVSGAEVIVSGAGGRWIFIEADDAPGFYINDSFRAVVRRNYSLSIHYEGRTFEAVSYAVGVSTLKNLQVQQDPETQLFRVVHNSYSNPVMTEVVYDWSGDPRYCESFGNCEAREFFYQLENVDVNQEFGPEKQVIWFPAGTRIERKNYSINDAHQQFLRSLLMETEWRGGLFDVQQGNIPTNITGGALGFFSVCMVDTQITIVN